MTFSGKLKLIGQELKNHSPFTLFGAITGILFMLVGQKWFHQQAQGLFAIFHPLHVVLSAMVTAALFKLHRKASSFLLILVIGVTGAITVATISDSILPFFVETILGAAIPTESAVHQHGKEPSAAEIHDQEEEAHARSEDLHDEHLDADEQDEHTGRPQLHLGFIEEWYLVFPAALIGVVLAYLKPATHLPHASHVLVSTWASSAHMLMNTHAEMSLLLLMGMFIALFLSVWLPCCASDIVWPLMFLKDGEAHIGHKCILCGKKENEPHA